MTSGPIADACRRLGLTREELARALGMTADALRRLNQRDRLDERTRLALVGLEVERECRLRPF
jgi:hypothetical protein